jgi:hypothetical protein
MNHVGTISRMRFIADGSTDIVHHCRPAEQPKVFRLKLMQRTGDMEELCRQFDNPSFMISRPQLPGNPPLQRSVNQTRCVSLGAGGR